MNRSLLTLTASALLLCSTAEAKEKPGFHFGNAEKGETAAQKQAIQYLPQNGERHGWDGSMWNHYEDVEFTYTSNNLNETIYYMPGATTPMTKDVELYDAAGHKVGTENYHYTGSAWHLAGGWREVHTHGANNRIEESVQEYYNSQVQAWDKEEKTVYAYDAGGKLLSETYQSWFNGSWINEDRFVFTYNGDVIIEGVQETYVGTGWDPEYRFINIVWHNQENFEVKSAIRQGMDNGTWVNEERISNTYGSNGSYVEVYEAWDGSQWVMDGRFTETYDSHGNEIEWKHESYVNDAWVVQQAEEQVHTYDGDKLVETILKYWNPSTQAVENAEKLVYSNFISYNTSVANLDNAEGVRFYPNPAENVLNISIEGSAYNTAVITDLSGRVVSSADITNTQQVQLDVSGLVSGIYILQLNGDNSSATERIVKK